MRAPCPQVLITSLIFMSFELPAGGSSLGTKLLELTCGAPASLVSVRTLDEAVVIAAALSMSSSAFVLQLLSERGETPTRFGSATLGILLFQVRVEGSQSASGVFNMLLLAGFLA
jgi:Kef-type K+ transport system membrane component KefB